MLVPIAAATALTISACALACLISRRARMVIPAEPLSERPTLVMAATGDLPDLEALFAALAAQTTQPRRLIVAVESDADPAAARVAALAPALPFPVATVVAGLAERSGQKSQNLAAALGALGPEDDPIVFLDADIHPQPWWLGAIASPIVAETGDFASGYRWAVPAERSFAVDVVAAIDRSIATLPRYSFVPLLWGGTTAAARRALAAIDAPAVLSRAISDDLALSDAARAAGLAVKQRAAVLVPTPMSGTAGALWRFGRRQYQMLRLHRPDLWAFAALVTTADALAWLVLLASAFTSPVAAAALALLTAANLARWALRDSIARAIGAPDAPPARRRQLIAALASPLVSAFHAGLVLGAARVREIRWRHVVYRVNGPKDVAVVSRAAPAE